VISNTILQSPRRFYRVVSRVVYFRHMNTVLCGPEAQHPSYVVLGTGTP
jgi:hypothetical protein